MDAGLDEKYYRLKNCLSEMGTALLAYSGGVDSTLLLAVGAEALGENFLAVTIDSPLQPRSMMETAARMSTRCRVEQIVIETDELADDGFASNTPERCYLCKHGRFSRLVDIATREGINEVIEGTHADDIDDYRPGMLAARELSILSPLVETGFFKYEIRALSRELGLSTWDMPADTCLATRIPYDERITREKIEAVGAGEDFLRELGFKDVRLRCFEGGVARIEVSQHGLARLAADGVRERVVDRMQSLGFVYVTLDLAGYRTGALNEALSTGPP